MQLLRMLTETKALDLYRKEGKGAYLAYASSLADGTTTQKKTAILMVSFGTSYADTREQTIGAVEQAVRAAFPTAAIFRAFTSGMIIRKMRSQGVLVDNVWEALEKLKIHSDVRVALLDIMLPGIDGFEVCRRIRATNAAIGIIMLTARSQEMDKVTGLMTGADDYVTKPFSPAELTARVDALMRRSGGGVVDAGEIDQPPFLLNTRNRTLEKNGQRIKLTQVEYAIMKMFMENPGKALSREEILDLVWGHDYFGELKIVDVNIRRLRLKIEDNATNPTYITTIWGFGYKWGL